MLTEWYDYRTHAEVYGTSQSGKSKFAEWCMREDAMEGNGFCLLDWHGTLYDAVLNYLAYLRPRRPVYLVNPSDPHLVTPFNPFRFRDGDVTAHAMRLAQVIVKPWGEENTNALPTYERLAQMLLTFMAVSGEPLHHAARLLEKPKKELREYAIEILPDGFIREEWKHLQYLAALKTGFRDWRSEVLSTQNRLMRFVASKSIKLFTGLKREGLDIDRAVNEGAIVLVNLKPSPFLAPESGKVFAALILSEFLHSALNHTGEERPYFLYLDECQNYLTTDAAQILDQVLKTGLRVTLLHHHAGQFHHNIPLQDSLAMNARIKVVFGGLNPGQAKPVAEEFFLPELNERWKKDDKVHYVTDYAEDFFETRTHTESTFGDENGSSDAVAQGSRLVPTPERIVDGQEDWTYEEKLSKLAQRFTSLSTRECYVRLPNGTLKREVPWVEPVLLKPETVLRFEKDLPNQIPLQDAEQILREQERAFLERSRAYESRGARPKKKPARLHPQG